MTGGSVAAEISEKPSLKRLDFCNASQGDLAVANTVKKAVGSVWAKSCPLTVPETLYASGSLASV